MRFGKSVFLVIDHFTTSRRSFLIVYETMLLVSLFSDHCITTVNVLGDVIRTGIVEHLSRDDLKSKTEENNPIVSKKLQKSDNQVELSYFSNL